MNTTAIGQPNVVAIVFFVIFIAITLAITYWAARRTRTTEHFYAAGRSISAGQNGFALAGDYMSAASFLGIAGLVSTTGFDGLIYSAGGLARGAVPHRRAASQPGQVHVRRCGRAASQAETSAHRIGSRDAGDSNP